MLTRRLPWRKATADRSGSVVVEFALVIPFLLTLLLGMYDIGVTLMVRFKVTSATQMTADLVTLASTATQTDITNFFNAGTAAMAPFSSSALQLRISNVATDGNNRAFVYWSCGFGGLSPLTAVATYTTTPDGTALTSLLQMTTTKSGNYTLSGANTSFILVESKNVFTAPAGLVFTSPQTILSNAYAMPRVSTFVGPTTGDASYVPPQPTAVRNVFPATFSGISCSFGY